MTNARLCRRFLLALSACAAIAGCSPGTSPSLTQDVAAPGVFLAEDDAIWDGRQKLGGVWATHPQNTSPERVLLTNQRTGQQTVAALYSGESGDTPPIKLSSDAAQALGIPANRRVPLRITALWRPSEINQSTSDGNTDEPPTLATSVDASNPAIVAAAPAPGLADTSTSSQAPRRSLRPEAAPLGARSALQIGIFSTRDNARRAQNQLRSAGVPAQISTISLNGTPYYNLGTGPIRTEAARERLLSIVRSAGYRDAYVTAP